MAKLREMLVVPPLGPLCWLHPDLARHHAPVRFEGPILDLRTDPNDIDGVLDRASIVRARSIRVLGGPRGKVIASELRSRIRLQGREGPKVIVDDGVCEPLEETLEKIAKPFATNGHPRARLVDAVPFFVTDPAHPTDRVHTRLPQSYWGVLPGDIWSDADRQAWTAELRQRLPQRVLDFTGLENHALAGIDLYRESFARRTPVLPRREPRPHNRPLFIGIDGIDGAGKSSHLTAVETWLTERGLRVQRLKMYRHGVFHATVTDMTRQCVDGHSLHLWPLQRHIKLLDSLKYWHEVVEPAIAEVDILLFDRYVHTHLAAGAGRYHHDPFAREMLRVFPRADLVFLMDLPIEDSVRRLGERSERTVDENPYMLGRFRAALLNLAIADGLVVLNAREPFAVNQARVRDELSRLLGGAV